MNVKRVTRLIALLQQLQSGLGDNADGLADGCGVSRRTVFRDIESLREAGVPIAFDADAKRYRIDGAHFLPPTNLTIDEALALSAVASRVEGLAADPLFAAAIAAADKIRTGLPPAVQEELREAEEAVVLRPPPVNPLADKQDVYQTLLEASRTRTTLRVRYDCLSEFQEFDTEFETYHLLFQDRSWYAIGRSARHDEIRTLNVGRVLEAAALDRRFDRPADFSLTRYLGNAWRMIPDDGPDQTIRLRFSRLVARNVSEVLWHPTQRCELNPDGTLEFFATISGFREVIWWILGYGDQVEVLGPDRLRKMVAQRLRAAADRYA